MTDQPTAAIVSQREAVAKALYECGFPDRRWANVDPHNQPFWLDHADAAIAAIRNLKGQTS